MNDTDRNEQLDVVDAASGAGGRARSTPASRRPRRTVRATVALMAMAILASVGFVAAPAPASAATGISYCFIQTNGYPLPLETTSLYVWYNGNWTLVGYGRTGTDGCGSFDTSLYSGYYAKVVAGTFTGKLRGEAPLWATPGIGSVHLGTGVAWWSW